MKKSEILFLLRNHVHEFNQNELMFIFDRFEKCKKVKFQKRNDYIDVRFTSSTKMLYLYGDGHVEWAIKKGGSEVLHNDLGIASTIINRYCIKGQKVDKL